MCVCVGEGWGEGLNYLRAHIHWLPSLGSGKLNSVCVWGGAELFTCYPVQGLGNSTVVLRVGDSYHVTSGVGDPVTWHSNTASVPTAADTAVNSDTNFGASVTGTQKLKIMHLIHPAICFPTQTQKE